MWYVLTHVSTKKCDYYHMLNISLNLTLLLTGTEVQWKERLVSMYETLDSVPDTKSGRAGK